MRSAKLLAGTAIAALTLGACMGPALAVPIDPLDSYIGPYTAQFHNYESFGNLTANGALQQGSTNFGIFNVTNITGTSPFPIFTPAPGLTLYGVFDGITVTSINNSGGVITTENSGGQFALYEIASPAANILTSGAANFSVFGQNGCALVAGCYAPITGAGTLVASWQLLPGADAAGSTLLATINTASVPISGSSFEVYANITGGLFGPHFGEGTGAFPTAIPGLFADLEFRDTFCADTDITCANSLAQLGISGGTEWADASTDPLSGRAVGVPEPASLALLGAGLLGLGAMRRRRRNA